MRSTSALEQSRRERARDGGRRLHDTVLPIHATAAKDRGGVEAGIYLRADGSYGVAAALLEPAGRLFYALQQRHRRVVSGVPLASTTCLGDHA